MPKTLEVDSGPHKKLVFVGHDDADAYDKQATYTGACVENADLKDIYQSGLPSAHERFLPIIVKSGITRGVNQRATDAMKGRAKDPTKVEPVAESYITYANRVKTLLEAKGPEGAAQWAALDAEVHAIPLVCDSSPTARQKGPDKSILAKADDILTRSDDAIEATVTKLLNVVEGFDLERDAEGKPERVSLARLVQEFMKESL